MQRSLIEWPGGAAVVALISTDNNLDPTPLTFTQAEEQRQSEFCRPIDAHRFMQLRIAARVFAAGELNVDARSLIVEKAPCPACGSNEHGPPRLISSGRVVPGSFSLSRSQNRGIILLSDEQRCAIDIEHIRPEGADAIESVLSRHERRMLAPLDVNARLENLYRLWSTKEAVLKAVGVGLVIDPTLVSTVKRRDNVSEVELLADNFRSKWAVHSAILQGNIALAVAGPA